METTFDLKSFPATLVAAILCLWIVCVFYRSFPDPQGTDFYPLWVGAKALVSGTDPYGQDTVERLKTSWAVRQSGTQVSDAIGYPLPVLMLFTPMTLLPLEVAVYVWFLVLLGAIAVFVLGVGGSRLELALIPLVSYPLFHALTIKTTAVLWLGLVGLLFIALRTNSVVISGLCIALLLGKPQAGLMFAIGALVWGLRSNRAIVLSAFIWVLLIWGGSVAFYPKWPLAWWQGVQTYRQQVLLVWLLPEGLLLLVFTRFLSWKALTAVTQVICFPLNDIYSSLPLLIGWLEMGGWSARLSVICSWLAVGLYDNPNNPLALWFTVLLPYCGCGLIYSFTHLSQAKERLDSRP